MQQPCPRCGYVSDRPARFCRQCGTPLFAETETTGAATRNYEPRQTDQPYLTPQSPLGSEYPPPGQETVRFYQPPPASNYSLHPVDPPRKSRAGLWILIAFLSLLLFGGGMIGLVSHVIRSQRQANNQSPLPPDFEDQLQKQIEREIERAQRAANQAQRDAERAADDAGAPNSPPPPLPPPAPAAGLEKYKYPNATVVGPIRIIGNELLKMRTEDNLDKVKAYYQKLIGEPLAESDDENENKLVFQSSGTPSVLVVIQPDDDHKGQLQILVFRSRFLVPRLNQ